MEVSTLANHEYRKQLRVRYERLRRGANQAIPMKTLGDPLFRLLGRTKSRRRSPSILGDEVYPGENILDKSGNLGKLGLSHTDTICRD